MFSAWLPAHPGRNLPVPDVDTDDPGPDLAPPSTAAPHRVFGVQPRDLHDRDHALHLADHRSASTVDGAPFAA